MTANLIPFRVSIGIIFFQDLDIAAHREWSLSKGKHEARVMSEFLLGFARKQTFLIFNTFGMKLA